MPVVPCFDPTTGASGGPAGGGGGGTVLYDLPLEIVNLTDGSWILEDPDSLVQSVSFNAGFNTVTWNALTGTADYRWDSGTTCRSPRWYKDINIDGNVVINSDYLIQSIRMELDKTVDDFYQMVVVGSGMNPTSVTLNDIRMMGGVMRKNTGGNVLYGAFTNNTIAGSANMNNDFSVTTHARGFASMGTSVYLNMNASETPLNLGNRNGQLNSTQLGSATMRLIIGVGIAGSTTNVTAGEQQKFSAAVVSLTTSVGA